MIFPEKSQGLDDKEVMGRETLADSLPSSSTRVYQPSAPSPTFPVEKAPTPPLIRLEYHPESSSSSRAISSPNFPTSFDNNLPPPSSSYYPDGSASSSHFSGSSGSSITNAETSVPMARPPPGSSPSFARPPSREATYPSFSPMFLVATGGKSLAKGFPIILPLSNSNPPAPHPFASHDVYEVEWMSFLREAQMVAALSPKQIELSEHLPILSIVSSVRRLASYGVQQLMKHQNASKVINCIDRWNRHFFEQREMRIILMKGEVRVSGQNDHSPPSNPSISQILTGVNDHVYRLFIDPLRVS